MGDITGFAFDRTNPRTVAWAKKHAAEMVEGVSKAARRRIRDLIVEGFEEEEDVDEIAEAIYEEIDDEARAETIARTEVVRASNHGQQEAWAQAVDEGLLTGDEQKEWITTPDDKLCPTCEAMDGERVYVWDDFTIPVRNSKGEIVDEVQETTPPAHPNCRCAMGIAAPQAKGRAAGGPGSGHHGHGGRPGEVGGSAPSGEGGTGEGSKSKKADDREPVGIDAGKKSGDWQVKWYSFPKGGAFTAKHVASFPTSKLKTPFEDLGGKAHSAEIAALAKQAGAVAPEGYELVYRVGSPEGKTLDDKNGANADGLAIFIEQTEEKMMSAGNTVHVFAVKFEAPFGNYELIRGKREKKEDKEEEDLYTRQRRDIEEFNRRMKEEEKKYDFVFNKDTLKWDRVPKKSRAAGGPGSGNFGHGGRPGEVGGSGPSTSEPVKTDSIGRPLKGYAKDMTQEATLVKSTQRYPFATMGHRRFLFNANTGTMALGANDTRKSEEWAHAIALEAGLEKSGTTSGPDTNFDNYGLRGYMFDDEIAIFTAPSDPAERFEALTMLVEHAVKNGASLDTVVRGRVAGTMLGDKDEITIREGWPEFKKKRPKAASATLLLAMAYIDRVLGGPGSGNFGHAGRPGEVGGSGDVGPGGGFTGRESQGFRPGQRFFVPEMKARRFLFHPSGATVFGEELGVESPTETTHAEALANVTATNATLPKGYDSYRLRGVVSPTGAMVFPNVRGLDFDPVEFDDHLAAFAEKLVVSGVGPDYSLTAVGSEATRERIGTLFPDLFKKKKARAAGSATSGNYGHGGRPGEVGGSAPGTGGATREERVIRARKAHKPFTREKDQWATKNETEAVTMLEGDRTDDNKPVDVVVNVRGKTLGVEVKTLLDNTNDKVTVRGDALERKQKWARSNHASLHTLVFDDRKDFGEKDLYSGNRLYYRRGVGSFRLGTMIPVRDADHLRELMNL